MQVKNVVILHVMMIRPTYLKVSEKHQLSNDECLGKQITLVNLTASGGGGGNSMGFR